MENSEPLSKAVSESFRERHSLLINNFYLCFRFAQEDVTLHDSLMKALYIQGGFPKECITQQAPNDILSITAPRVHHEVGKRSIDLTRMRQVRERWDRLVGFRKEVEEGIMESLNVETILKGMISKDNHYQDHPRPGRKIPYIGPPDTQDDPYASFVRKYVVHGSHTGSEGLNNLFRKLRTTLDYEYTAMETMRSIPNVVIDHEVMKRKWERNHAGKNYFEYCIK